MATNSSFDLNSSPSHLLHRAQQIAANLSASALKDAGLTLRQFSVLAALSGNEGISQSDLVTATGIDRSTLADMVARMESGGLIKRAASKLDARAKSVSTMAKGRKALAKAQASVEAADAALMGLLPKSRQDALLVGLTRLVASAEDDEKAATPVVAKPAPKAAPKKKKAAPKKKKASTAKKAAPKPKKKPAKKKKKKS
jgi:DNA-binding MarR family transcriptional regulator